MRQLLAKAERSDFQAQYGLRSSLMGSVKPGERMRATTKAELLREARGQPAEEVPAVAREGRAGALSAA